MKKIVLTLMAMTISLSAMTGNAQENTHANDIKNIPQDGDNGNLRLGLTEVMLYADNNNMDDAFKLLDKLKKQYPNNSQILATEADLKLRVGNRGSGLADLNKALLLDPRNEDILEQQHQALVTQGQFASVGDSYRHTNQANENLSRISAQELLMPGVSGGAAFENDHLDSKGAVRRSDGSTRSFNGNKQRGTLSLGKLYDNGNETTGLLYVASDSVGLGVEGSAWDHSGKTTLEANFQKPDWDYVETVVGDGTKDNIRVARQQFLTMHMEGTLGAGFNRYGMHGDSNVANSVAWDLNLDYTYPYALSHQVGDEIILGATYTVDAEYFTRLEDKLDSSGNIYNPIPAISYEVHAVTLSAGKNLTHEVYAEGFGGYAVDRLGGDGPLFGGALKYNPIDHLSFALTASRGIMAERDSSKVDQIGLNLKWSW